MYLKIKSFTSKSEALNLTGGGENRTLVLSILHNDYYMLSALKNGPTAMQSTPIRLTRLIQSRYGNLKTVGPPHHTKYLTIDPKTLGPILGYRAA